MRNDPEPDEKKSGAAEKIDGISFCSQMQGLVLVDKEGNALRRPMSYMDQRARKEMKDCQGHGIQIAGVNVRMLMKSLRATHAASTSVKDPLWKYKWVQQNEPEIFAKVYKWLDVKEYLISRCTDRFIMTRDSGLLNVFIRYAKRQGRMEQSSLPYVWRRSGASSGTDRVHGYRRETYCKGRLRAGAFPGDLRIWRGW